MSKWLYITKPGERPRVTTSMEGHGEGWTVEAELDRPPEDFETVVGGKIVPDAAAKGRREKVARANRLKPIELVERIEALEARLNLLEEKTRHLPVTKGS